ncbi:hypothetical protein [Paraflavitalea speifideaquila]|uniref:hypothetical protein n=1 Tax=Paraflavitalea speifideaquila TaxID=3076558 RepID=UPI0028E8FF90|nr:hypothetical protein [Paraflavitalea speifideiaquila]
MDEVKRGIGSAIKDLKIEAHSLKEYFDFIYIKCMQEIGKMNLMMSLIENRIKTENMNKKTKYALYAGTAGGVINGILNIIKQNNENSSLPLDYSQVLKAVAKGAAACGACGFIIGAYVDHQNSLEKPLNTDLKLGNLVKNCS